MEYGNINWILAIACLLAGAGIGALCHRLLSSSAHRSQRLRQRVAERERELAQLKETMAAHFKEVGTLVGNIQREAQTLERRLAEDATTLGDAAPAALRSLDIDEATGAAATEENLPAPRDYADGSGGTLAEDFGLKPDGETSRAPQPPRY